MLKDHTIPPLKGDAPTSAVIILHGYGDSGSGGLLEIGQLWQRSLPHTEFLCPDAPFPFEMAPPDFGGRQWFSLRTTDPHDIEAGVVNAAPYVNDYIDHVLATRHLKPSQLVLSGFSQGSMMSLYVGPRRAEQLAGVIGYSGMLVGGDKLAAEKKTTPPVLLAHGTADDVVPFARMDQAERGLKAVNIPVTAIPCPGTGHGIDQKGLQEGLRFLLEKLPPIPT